jgi:hydrogenase nickel incorporation protein HypA/HybF
VIEDVPIVAYCPTCDAQQQIESPQQLTCPACGTPTPSLIHGSELELFAMEIADDAAANR